MFRSFFTSTLRNLWRTRSNSLLNVLGLAIGIACAALIFLWAEDEKSFDHMHAKRDRIYLVMENQKYDAYVFTHSSTPALLGPALQAQVPGVAATCRRSEGLTSQLFTVDGKPVNASGFYAEPSLFSLFTLPFAQGSAAHPFSQRYSLVLTEKSATKFFGTAEGAVGKTVRVDNKQDYVVSGVVKDLPANSSVQFEWVAPFPVYFDNSPWLKEWGNNSLTTYVELSPTADAAAVNKALHNFIQQRLPESITRLFLFAMPQWHLYDKFENGVQTGGGRIQFVRLFTTIAWIVLLIACINFMNLATARSERRAREVGVRKVLGAAKQTLVLQFIGEALLMAAVAAVVALVIVSLVLPAFNTLVQKELVLGLDKPSHLAGLALVTFLCGLVAGSYPSLYLSSFNPVFVLKGVKLKTGSAALVRKGLVVFQFTTSIVLIIGTLVIFQQIQHVKNRPLGFNKDNLLEVSVQGEAGARFAGIRQDLANTGVVESAALSDHTTLYGGNNTDGLTWAGKAPGSKVLVSGRNVTPEFFTTSGLQLLEGRGLQMSDSLYTDGATKKMNTVVTQSFARLMGEGSAVGKVVYNEGDPSTKLTVVGVVNDYVYGNVYGKPDPVAFLLLPPEMATVMYVRTKAQSNAEQALAAVETVLKRHNPAYPFDYRFVDDQFNRMFVSEALMGKLARIFAALAVLISCLGLFGLAAYTAERRTKEIGIRKVLGASVAGVAGLLSKDFLQLVAVAVLIAFPVAWWMMSAWLQNFEYRTVLGWWVFAAAGFLAVFVALLTVSFQAVKAALANPVKSLRTE